MTVCGLVRTHIDTATQRDTHVGGGGVTFLAVREPGVTFDSRSRLSASDAAAVADIRCEKAAHRSWRPLAPVTKYVEQRRHQQQQQSSNKKRQKCVYDASVDGHVSTRAVNARPKMEILCLCVPMTTTGILLNFATPERADLIPPITNSTVVTPPPPPPSASFVSFATKLISIEILFPFFILWPQVRS